MYCPISRTSLGNLPVCLVRDRDISHPRWQDWMHTSIPSALDYRLKAIHQLSPINQLRCSKKCSSLSLLPPPVCKRSKPFRDRSSWAPTLPPQVNVCSQGRLTLSHLALTSKPKCTYCESAGRSLRSSPLHHSSGCGNPRSYDSPDQNWELYKGSAGPVKFLYQADATDWCLDAGHPMAEDGSEVTLQPWYVILWESVTDPLN